uniref:Uncharacterized protein n=1 Tax=Nicotiana tabacum TaxID=4097 RepID=A0A1S4BM79_TOBAC|nr:PREDICTED: uncharacterized protein LOC107809822 [Nicotiana tabacum]
MGRMLQFMDTMTQASLVLADPATSQAGGGAHTPTAQALGHATILYQTPGALPTVGAQPITAVVPEPRPTADGDSQRGHTGRGHPSKPPYSAPPPPPRGAPVRSYFSVMPESSYCPPAIQGFSGGYLGPQGSSDSYFSAMPESSYRPPAMQASSNGSTGHQG